MVLDAVRLAFVLGWVVWAGCAFDRGGLSPTSSPDQPVGAVDAAVWSEAFEMIWDPVFSPDGEHVLAKAERDSKYFIVVNGKIAGKAYDALWEPEFSPDGKGILLKYVEDGKYHRQVVPASELI